MDSRPSLKQLYQRAVVTGIGAPNIPWCGRKKIFTEEEQEFDGFYVPYSLIQELRYLRNKKDELENANKKLIEKLQKIKVSLTKAKSDIKSAKNNCKNIGGLMYVSNM